MRWRHIAWLYVLHLSKTLVRFLFVFKKIPNNDVTSLVRIMSILELSDVTTLFVSLWRQTYITLLGDLGIFFPWVCTMTVNWCTLLCNLWNTWRADSFTQCSVSFVVFKMEHNTQIKKTNKSRGLALFRMYHVAKSHSLGSAKTMSGKSDCSFWESAKTKKKDLSSFTFGKNSKRGKMLFNSY